MSYFNNPFNQFFDNNKPQVEISHDRVFGSGIMGDYCILFKRCKHVLTIPMMVIDSMCHRGEIVDYINKLECRECQREFASMESELTRQYKKFMEGGGFKK